MIIMILCFIVTIGVFVYRYESMLSRSLFIELVEEWHRRSIDSYHNHIPMTLQEYLKMTDVEYYDWVLTAKLPRGWRKRIKGKRKRVGNKDGGVE